ncbi:hypothetical protein Rmf_39710 [Roseomonas fluvialis]|uniref:Uncharacterized protein n=2 Tax=Roseomonas fluvialis TaxID=1750527 RepID=A0ABM7Y7X4_9PROT|nr:hypothetical protein Rmf_39710 [Roseomonas fluvialis]
MCHSTSIQTTLASTNRFGTADLDLRPPEMVRSTMTAWIQACPNCGYVAEKIGVELLTPDLVRRVLAGDRWRELMFGWKGPDLASAFLRASLLKRELGQPHDAADSALRAAWVADDRHDRVLSIECRKEATQLTDLALEGKDPDDEACRRMRIRQVDILRRAEIWTAAERLCEDLLDGSPEGTAGIVLRFQASLIQKRDTYCYAISDALRWTRPPLEPGPEGDRQQPAAGKTAPWMSALRWLTSLRR